MKNILKTITMLIFSSSIEAGPFMDFDLGLNLTDYHNNDEALRILNNDNPAAIVRLGYETDKYYHDGGLIINGHAYLEHISSLQGLDSGINVLMIGVRLGI